MKSVSKRSLFIFFFLLASLIEPAHGSRFKRPSHVTEDMLILSVFIMYVAQAKILKRPRSYWVKNYLRQRKVTGRFTRDYHDMRRDPDVFKENFHVTVEQFDSLLELVKGNVSPEKHARKTETLSAEEKLCMTLEVLASGSLQRHIASVYRSSKQNFGPTIEKTSWVIYHDKNKICTPTISQKYWTESSNRFHRKWNFPNCVGAVDGKHVKIEKPQGTGSIYFNYKDSHSVNLMAVCDADYKFIWLDCGSAGSNSDSTIFAKGDLGSAFFAKKLGLPPARPVHGLDIPLFVVADDAFPLHENIMKPYVPSRGKTLTPEERIFNYRLSRARRCIENAFGVLCVRWLCLKRTLLLKPLRVKAIVLACCLLHNYLIKTSNDYCPQRFADSYDQSGALILGTWRQKVPEQSMFNSGIPKDQRSTPSGRPSSYSKKIRDHLKSYVNSSAGSLPWPKKRVYLE